MSITSIFPIRQGPGSEESNLELSQKLNEWLGHSGPTGLFRTCATCRMMEQAPNPAHCRMFGATPPIDVIMKGCDNYQDEAEVPFT